VLVEPGQERQVTLSTAGLPTGSIAIDASYAWTEPAGTVRFARQFGISPLTLASRAGIRVDGDLGDWDSLPGSTYVNHPDGTSEADFTAAVRAAYDDTHLYLAIRVRDDSVCTDDDSMGKVDAMDLYWHVPAESRSDLPNVPEGYVKICVAPQGQPVRPPSWKLGQDQTAPQMTYASRLTAEGHVYEIAIDLAALGVRTAAAPGQQVWLRMGFNDLDMVDGQIQPRQRYTTCWPQVQMYNRCVFE
jgi:hypothetical protein